MKRILKYTLMVLSSVVLSATLNTLHAQTAEDWAKTNRYELANSQVSKKPKAVLMGDSITYQWYDKDPDFFNDNNLLGRGIGGQCTPHMLVRFRSDVLNNHPKYVAIMAGTNDLAGNNGPISQEKMMENIISMCELAKANKIKVLLCSVTPVIRYPWSKTLPGDPSPVIMEFNARLKSYADATRGVTYVDYFSALKAEDNLIKPEYTTDGCHLTIEAYKILEDIILGYIR